MLVEALKHELHRLRWSLHIRGLIAVALSFIAAFALISGITLLIGAFRMGALQRATTPA